jgi:hypothetical protein
MNYPVYPPLPLDRKFNNPVVTPTKKWYRPDNFPISKSNVASYCNFYP